MWKPLACVCVWLSTLVYTCITVKISFFPLAVDLTPWKDKIEEERNIENEINQECEVEEVTEVVVNTRPEHHERYKDGVLTIGTIGYPNVGKSSLINALMGKKVSLCQWDSTKVSRDHVKVVLSWNMQMLIQNVLGLLLGRS